jgi:hypothetical protein
MAVGDYYDKLVKLLQKQDIGHSAAAEELGLPVSGISSLAFSQALVDSGREDSAPATAKSVMNLRDNERNRWELIAARIGESVARAKELYEEAGGDASAPLPPLNGEADEAPSRGSRKSGPARKTGTATKASSKKSSAAKSGSKTKSKSAAARPRGRARTLAQRRAARSENPS